MDETIGSSTSTSLSTLGLGDSEDSSGTPSSPEGQPPSGFSVRLKQISWVLFTLFCLAIFTLLKLPEDRIQAYVQGSINDALSSQGITLTAAKSYISVGLGLTYTMKDVVLNLPPPSDKAKIQQISVSPSFLPLLLGRIAGKAWVYTKGDGKLTASFSLPRNTKSGPMLVSLSADAKQIDLGSLGLLKSATGVQGSAIANGTVDLQGDLSVPSTLTGHADIDLSKMVIDSQTVMGFNIPRISVSDGRLDINFDKGKAVFRTFRIGKSPSDDIRATITGDMPLGRTWLTSTLNAKADFSLSDTILKSPSLSLIDALLSPGKKPDGSYSYNLNGMLTSLMPTPNK